MGRHQLVPMYSKRSDEGDGPDSRPVRTSDRLRGRSKFYNRPYLYYPPAMGSKRRKTKPRTAAADIAKILRTGNRGLRTSNANQNYHDMLPWTCCSHRHPISAALLGRGGFLVILYNTRIVLEQRIMTEW
ncbi:hypothetical protein BUALT_Bualt01G0004400 [Buddleja alternifolia]|uniref:Uncharacterized protein n=1 Tax=Buddleja alternifolia TaxID=168488 RepID=A0AAV6Y4E0_9LAMI|nr:hypothetical protein BUALT_Bualt01G0004400 [Buddleja alternifolia]